jgi:DNA repair protein RecO (recombination protein O)
LAYGQEIVLKSQVKGQLSNVSYMPTYKTKAIVLSSYPYRDYDRIVTFFSGEFGKIDARARGLRKITSKLAGHLEPFIETELLLANGRRWDILAGSRTINPRIALRADIEKLSAASVCAEAVKLVARPMSQEPRYFSLLCQVFEEIEKTDSALKYREIVLSFLWKMIFVSGFGPEIDHCIQCRKSVVSGSFSFEGGGMLCKLCQSRDIMSQEIDERGVEELKSFELAGASSQGISERFWKTIIDYQALRSLEFFGVL